jgi:hypothetical protein
MKRFLFACLLMLGASPAFAQTVLSYSSSPGDWVGQGEAKSYTTTNSLMGFSATRSAIRVSIDGNDGSWWNLAMIAPVGEELMPGKYTDAERAPFVNGRAPGLEFTGTGRGCNQVWGEFTIRQIKFDTAGNLTRLEGTALQYCDGGPPLALEVRYRASYYMFGVDSPKAHWVGQGIKQSYYNDSSIFQGNSGSPNQFSFSASGLRTYWTAWIALPPGQTRFTKGSFQTRRFAGGAFGQLDVSSTGRGCNEALGTVNVLEVVYGPNDRIDKFYADFTHYCESTASGAMKGRIRWVRGI